MFFLAPLFTGLAGAIGTAASIVGSVGAAGLGAAGAVGSAALGTAGAIGQAAIGGVTAAAGGISKLATVAKPAAELFGAVYGTMGSIEQAKVQKRAQALAEKQYPSSAQISQEALELRGTQAPIETMADLMLKQPAAASEATGQAGLAKADIIEQLGPYLPLLAIGLVGILLLRGRK